MDNPNKLEHIFQFLCQSVRLGSIQSEMSNSPQYAINPFCLQSFHTTQPNQWTTTDPNLQTWCFYPLMNFLWLVSLAENNFSEINDNFTNGKEN